MGRLLLLFIAVPAVELMLLIEVGARIGTLPTVAIIFATGLIGAGLARHQGLRTIGTIQRQLAAGELPASALVDGVIILVAGALLMTPGILTDAVGFLCLIPATRHALKRRLMRRFEQAVAEQRIHVATAVSGTDTGSGPIYDVPPSPPHRDDR